MRSRMGVASHKKALITPTLFSQPSTRPAGEKRETERARFCRGGPVWPPCSLPGTKTGRPNRPPLQSPSLPGKGGWRAGREGLGSEGFPHPRPQPEPHERRRQIEQIGQRGRILDVGRELPRQPVEQEPC